jgi:hypothetical protein
MVHKKTSFFFQKINKFNLPALFMARDPKFLESIPFHRIQFSEDETSKKRMQFVKQKLWQSIDVKRFVTYTCLPQPMVTKAHGSQLVKLTKLDTFVKTVWHEFF